MFKNADAVSKGVEFELRALVTPDWMVGLIYTYTDAKFDNALVPCNDYNGDNVPDVDGTPRVQPGKFVSECLSNTTLGSLPKTSISAMTNYNFHVGGFDPYIRANVITRDKSYFPQTGPLVLWLYAGERLCRREYAEVGCQPLGQEPAGQGRAGRRRRTVDDLWRAFGAAHRHRHEQSRSGFDRALQFLTT
jgi:hypothetical protein